ncbi:MAG: hypothetical protein AAFR61_13030 [Bacteroidota bacterium]
MNDTLQTISNAFNTVIRQVVEFIPNLVVAAFLILLGYILAKVFSGVVGRLLRRVGLDKLASKLNDTDFFKDSNFTIKPVVIIQKFIYWIIFLIFILSGTEVLGLPILTQQVSKLIAFIPDLLTAFFIMALGFYLANSVKTMVANACKSFGIPAWKFISGAVFFILFLVVVVTALDQIGIDTEVLTRNEYIILGGAIAGFAIAYGFAARNVLSSMLSSFYSRGNIELGQVLEIDGVKGKVVRHDNVTFTLDAGDTLVVIPMRRLLEGQVIIHKQS